MKFEKAVNSVVRFIKQLPVGTKFNRHTYLEHIQAKCNYFDKITRILQDIRILELDFHTYSVAKHLVDCEEVF